MRLGAGPPLLAALRARGLQTAAVQRRAATGRAAPVVVVLLAVVAVLAAVVTVQVAVALQRPSPRAAVEEAAATVGADASWPACTPPHGTMRTLPLAARPAFVVVGVNDGLPGTRSACLERELAWAGTTTGGSSQPKLSYYVMAADPWAAAELRWIPHPAWPTSNTVAGVEVAVPPAYASALRGTVCGGGHTERACAYVYGWTMARADAALPGLRSPADHRFWIDVEALQDWSGDPVYDQAVVEGMVAAFTAPPSRGGVGTTVGLYSDRGEWPRIVGALRAGSPIDPLDEWLAIGGATRDEAQEALRHGIPLTPHGRIRMVQYLDGPFDRDLAAAPR